MAAETERVKAERSADGSAEQTATSKALSRALSMAASLESVKVAWMDDDSAEMTAASMVD